TLNFGNLYAHVVLRPEVRASPGIFQNSPQQSLAIAGTSSFHLEKIQDLLARDPLNFDTFGPAVFAALDSNSRLWPFQKFRQENDQRFVGAAFYRGRAKAYLQRAF